jgi:hypothetical protein
MRFSANYLHREAGFHRFFIILCLFLAGIQLVCWPATGCSPLSAGKCAASPPSCSSAMPGSARWRPAMPCSPSSPIAAAMPASCWPRFCRHLAGQFRVAGAHRQPAACRWSPRACCSSASSLAALAKSAQLPFTPWITRALEGPTPSSAIFYGAVMVHAGVYLLLRLSPLLAQVPDVMIGLVVVGIDRGSMPGCAGWCRQTSSRR